IFAPLGMSHSDLSVADIERADDHALPYELKKEVVTKVPFHNIDAIGPAGAINSSVDDMAHYLIFQLGEGRYDGKPIVAESDLREMHSPQTAIPDPPPAFSMSGLGHFSYGLAWVVTAYRGHNLVWHNGGIDGFYALLSMLPDDHLGVVVLTNLPHGQTPEVLAYNVLRSAGSILCPGSIGSRTLKPKARNRKRKPRRTSPPTARPARIPRTALRSTPANTRIRATAS